nr:hypothetical protein [uncultured Actinoplanes sp.]
MRLRALPDRGRELLGAFAGMNDAMEEICAGYDAAQLEVIADFLRRTAAAGREATERLA